MLEKIDEKCTYVTNPPTEALPCSTLKAMFPCYDNSEWTAAGFGSTSNFRGQVRQKKKGLNFDYFYTLLPGRVGKGIIGLKPAAGHASSSNGSS